MGTQFRLTKEESALMDECRKTSFWYRSVPLMAITTALMTYRRVNNQIQPKFYGIKLAGTMLASYMVGKVSYIPECRRLILERLPNSNLARSLESKQYELISDITQPPEIVSKTTTTNIFGNRDEQEEEHDVAILPTDLTDKSTPRKTVTYDELRQKNRAEFAAKFPGTKARNDTSSIKPVIVDSKQSPPLPIINNEESSQSTVTSAPKRSHTRKNQYGDEIYD